MAVIRDATFPIEVVVRQPTLTAIRTEIVAKLVNDARLTSLLGPADATSAAPRVFWRPYRDALGLPVITCLDFGARPDSAMPLMDRIYQIDVWGRSLDETEAIAERVVQLINPDPLPLPNGQARADLFALTADRDDVADEGDVSRKTLEFRMLAFEIR